MELRIRGLDTRAVEDCYFGILGGGSCSTDTATAEPYGEVI